MEKISKYTREDDKWINKNILKFDEILRKNFNKEKKEFLKAIINSLSISTSAVSGIFYELIEKNNFLEAVAGYATKINDLKPVPFGEGLIGQSAKDHKILFINDVDHDYASIYLANIKINLKNLLFIPIVFNGSTHGVIELHFIKEVKPCIYNFIQRVAVSIAVMMESIRKNEETRKQKEKLAIQGTILQDNLDTLNKTKNELENQKQRAEEALKELSIQGQRINESINYALRIQQSILPSEQKLKKNFRDAFLIFKPKDIVSGDFYWYAETNLYQFVSVVDCTGHGVPGAFMSMIGNTLLNQIILEKKVYNPEEVLTCVHQGIRLNLLQESKESKDGMDMMLCRISKDRDENGLYEISVAGAKSYFYCIEGDELYTFKGNSRSIGGARSLEDLKFTPKIFKAGSGAKIIILSDGWIDNANNARKRYGTKRFREILKENTHLTLSELKIRLQEDMSLHQQDMEQRDDITLLSIQL